MIAPVCSRCDQELKEFGALAFSPPENGMVGKWHLCVKCWDEFQVFIDTDIVKAREAAIGVVAHALGLSYMDADAESADLLAEAFKITSREAAANLGFEEGDGYDNLWPRPAWEQGGVW